MPDIMHWHSPRIWFSLALWSVYRFRAYRAMLKVSADKSRGMLVRVPVIFGEYSVSGTSSAPTRACVDHDPHPERQARPSMADLLGIERFDYGIDWLVSVVKFDFRAPGRSVGHLARGPGNGQ